MKQKPNKREYNKIFFFLIVKIAKFITKSIQYDR